LSRLLKIRSAPRALALRILDKLRDHEDQLAAAKDSVDQQPALQRQTNTIQNCTAWLYGFAISGDENGLGSLGMAEGMFDS
jgi:hypothetical protein